jgi:hypothetical protein
MAKAARHISAREKAKRKKMAIELFRAFREEDPDYLEEVGFSVPDVAMVIGTLDTVEYTTRRGGRVEMYRHEFDEKSKPLLVASFDGKQIIIIGGRYDFTEVGIKDY